MREAKRPAGAPEDPLAEARFTRFTDWEGTEAAAEISPNGRYVAFAADRDGEFDIWQSQVGTGEFHNLTREVGALEPGFYTFRKIGFSGDGANIWFSHQAGPSMAQMILPLMDGTPRAFLDKGRRATSWPPSTRGRCSTSPARRTGRGPGCGRSTWSSSAPGG